MVTPSVGAAHAPGVRAKLFRGLADPSRLALVEALREGRIATHRLVPAVGALLAAADVVLAACAGIAACPELGGDA